MKTLLAALAAAMIPLVFVGPTPAHASEAVAAIAKINEHDHIRTTLHGSHGPVAVLIPGMRRPERCGMTR